MNSSISAALLRVAVNGSTLLVTGIYYTTQSDEMLTIVGELHESCSHSVKPVRVAVPVRWRFSMFQGWEKTATAGRFSLTWETPEATKLMNELGFVGRVEAGWQRVEDIPAFTLELK